VLTELLATLARGGQGPARARSFGPARIFSAGLDVPELMTKDAPACALLEALLRRAASARGQPDSRDGGDHGPQPGGGAVLAMYCDYGVMAEGAFQ